MSKEVNWQAECLKKGFEYVREPDDHYVIADPSEMVALLRDLLGVDVRTKECDSYGVAVSELQEQIDGLVNTLHAQQAERDALLAERDALKKDREARDWEMKAKGVMNVIHLVVSKYDQDVLRRYANDMLDEAKQLYALQGEQP